MVFTVSVDHLPSPSDVRTLLLLNTDMNPATGAPDSYGADYIFLVDESDNSYGFGRWNGSNWEMAPSTTVAVSSGPTGVTISVNRSELGNTTGFNFWTRIRTGDVSANQFDDAPDVGSWNYTLAAGGPSIVGLLLRDESGARPEARAAVLTRRGRREAPARRLAQLDRAEARATAAARSSPASRFAVSVPTAARGCSRRSPAGRRSPSS